jgi:hypothetical protein
MKRLACTLALTAFATACGGGDGCIEGVPFSSDTNLTQADADRFGSELGVVDLTTECEAVCMLVEDEATPPPDGSTYSITQIDTCTLMMPSTDGAGDPVDGYVRCEGTGARCP